MPIEIFNVPQRSEEWYRVRMGIPTASMFSAIMVQNDTRKGRASYMRKLAGEILTDIPMESYTNDDMDRGRE